MYVETVTEEKRHMISMDTSGSFEALFENSLRLGVNPEIINIIKRAQKVSGIDKIYAVIGGLHISSTNESIEVEVVRPMHNTEFCKHCNRIRVTLNGRFKPCLFTSDNLVDFLDPMRNRASDEALRELFVEAVKRREPFFT